MEEIAPVVGVVVPHEGSQGFPVPALGQKPRADGSAAPVLLDSRVSVERLRIVIRPADLLLPPGGVAVQLLAEALRLAGAHVAHDGGQLGMRVKAVVALEEVLGHQLPVGADDVADSRADLGCRPSMGRKEVRDVPGEGIERRGRPGQADEDQSFNNADMATVQGKILAIEAVGHVPGGEQGPVQSVGPGVVRTDEALDRTLLLQADPGSAMPADIEQGADLVVPVPDDHHRLSAQRVEEIVASGRQPAHVAHDLPMAQVDPLHVQLEDPR